MSSDPLAPVVDFHQQLRQLNSVGIQWEFDNGRPLNGHSSLDDLITTVEGALRIRTDLSQPLPEAIVAEKTISNRHRDALLNWMETADLSTSIPCLTEPARVINLISSKFQLSLVRPIALIILAIIAFGILFRFTLPQWERIESVRYATSDPAIQVHSTNAVKVLANARNILLVDQLGWAHIVATTALLLGMITVLWRTRFVSRTFRSRVSNGIEKEALLNAAYATHLAEVVENGGAMPGELSELPSRHTLSFSKQGSALLTWISAHNFTPEDQPLVYRAAASFYEAIAQEHRRSWRANILGRTLVVVGTLLVALFALSVFLPMFDMLMSLTSPRAIE